MREWDKISFLYNLHKLLFINVEKSEMSKLFNRTP